MNNIKEYLEDNKELIHKLRESLINLDGMEQKWCKIEDEEKCNCLKNDGKFKDFLFGVEINRTKDGSIGLYPHVCNARNPFNPNTPEAFAKDKELINDIGNLFVYTNNILTCMLIKLINEYNEKHGTNIISLNQEVAKKFNEGVEE